MNTDKYLERINYSGKTGPNLENLKKLHKSHLFSIPFENLDIGLKRKIILNSDLIENKILFSKRGGYCYELNGLFHFLLKDIGYNVKMISARVNNGKGGWGAEFDHLANVVELDELWLADVGFGDNFLEPVEFIPDKIQKNLNGFFRISPYKNDDETNDSYVMSKSAGENENSVFNDDYIFSLKERIWEEFEGMNSYHQTSSESHFTQKNICTIATAKGRITLTDNKLIITENNKKQTAEIRDKSDFSGKLYDYFKIKL